MAYEFKRFQLVGKVPKGSELCFLRCLEEPHFIVVIDGTIQLMPIKSAAEYADASTSGYIFHFHDDFIFAFNSETKRALRAVVNTDGLLVAQEDVNVPDPDCAMDYVYHDRETKEDYFFYEQHKNLNLPLLISIRKGNETVHANHVLFEQRARVLLFHVDILAVHYHKTGEIGVGKIQFSRASTEHNRLEPSSISDFPFITGNRRLYSSGSNRRRYY